MGLKVHNLASEPARSPPRAAAALARAHSETGRLSALGAAGARPLLRRAAQRAEPDGIPKAHSGAFGGRRFAAAARPRATCRRGARLTARWLPTPRIWYPYPNQRLASFSQGGSRPG